MKKSLFFSDGTFYKANLHTHTNYSDGRFSPKEMKALYRERGYSIVAFSDHEILVPHPELISEDFLPLTATEYAFEESLPLSDVPLSPDPPRRSRWRFARMYHTVLIAPRMDETYYPWATRSVVSQRALPHLQDYCVGEHSREFDQDTLNEALKDAKDHGFITILAHPYWSMNQQPFHERLKNVDYVETYNSHNVFKGFLTDDSDKTYDDFLMLGKRVYPAANDDSHIIEDVGHGATYIKSRSLAYPDVIESLRRGDVFATSGPKFNEISLDPDTLKLYVESDPVRSIAVSTYNRSTFIAGSPFEGSVSCAEFDLSSYFREARFYDSLDKCFFRVTLLSETGNRAYSRAFFLSDLIARFGITIQDWKENI